MPEDMFTADGHPISPVRVVSGSTVRTIGGNPVTAVRIMEGPNWSPSLLYTPSGFPVRSVRLVDDAGLYTTNRAATSAQPEDMYTPDGNPIEAVRIFSSVPAPEVVITGDGYPIEAVRLVDDNGVVLGMAAETTSWASQVVTNGGTVSANRQALIDQFIFKEKAAGTWALTDDYWALWAENAPQALTSLKQRRLAAVVAAPLFTADRGYTFDGVANYINSGFIPSTNALAMTGTDMRIAVYERIGTSLGAYSAGITQVANQNLGMIAYSSGVMGSVLNSAQANAGGISNALGFSAASRAGGTTTVNSYKNGAILAPQTAGTIAAVLPTIAMFIGCRNGSGTPLSFRATQSSFVAVGAPLSNAQETAQYSNVQAWASAIGAAV